MDGMVWEVEGRKGKEEGKKVSVWGEENVRGCGWDGERR